MIEAEIARLAARRATVENIDRIAFFLDKMRSSTDGLRELTQNDTYFHMEIAKASGNRVLESTMESTKDLFQDGVYHAFLIDTEENVRQPLRPLEELIRFSAAAGSKVVTIGSFRGRAAPAGGLEAAGRQLHEAISAVDELACELDVTIALEPINKGESDFLTDACETCRFIDAGGYRSVGLLLDSYHVFLSESELWRRSAFTAIVWYTSIWRTASAGPLAPELLTLRGWSRFWKKSVIRAGKALSLPALTRLTETGCVPWSFCALCVCGKRRRIMMRACSSRESAQDILRHTLLLAARIFV